MTLQFDKNGLAIGTDQLVADEQWGDVMAEHRKKLAAIMDAAKDAIGKAELEGRRGVFTGKGVGERLAEIKQQTARKIMETTAASRKALAKTVAAADHVLSTLNAPEASSSNPELRASRERRYDQIIRAIQQITDPLLRESEIKSSIAGDSPDDARDLVLALQGLPAIVRRTIIKDAELAKLREQLMGRMLPDTLKERSAAKAALGNLAANEQFALQAVGASKGLTDRLKHERRAAAVA